MSILVSIKLNVSLLFKHLIPAQPCILCGTMSDAGLWCADCERSLPYLRGPSCRHCALLLPSGDICGHCLSNPPRFDRTTALYAYTFPINKLIQQLKYTEQLALADAFAAKLMLRIPNDELPDCIIPMPLHPNKLKQRGYNQALLLARSLSKRLDIALLPNVCKRVRDTASQSSLPYKARVKNMRDAFLCDVSLKGRKVVLVDDVFTSGASLNALAKAVTKRGAEKVETWVVARTIRHG